MTWQEELLTRIRSFLTPVFVARRGDGSNELESVAKTEFTVPVEVGGGAQAFPIQRAEWSLGETNAFDGGEHAPAFSTQWSWRSWSISESSRQDMIQPEPRPAEL
jgi:hypothetical protein